MAWTTGARWPRVRLDRRLLTAFAAAAAIAGAAIGSSLGAGAADPPVVSIKALEFKFEPQGEVEVKPPASAKDQATLVVAAGEVIFKVTNEGAIEHNFIVWDKDQKTLGEIPVLSAGETQEVRIGLKPGRYTIVCTYPGHSELGMALALEAR